MRAVPALGIRNGRTSPAEPRNFTREFDRRCERAGVRHIRVHDTRHTCASLLDGRQESWRLLYFAAARTTEATYESSYVASDQRRGGGI
ncbi:hypothetical protein SUDANB105_03416 [Streptomyces sp. enrichment culture]